MKGQLRGPYTRKQLSLMWERGLITSDSFCRLEHSKTWSNAVQWFEQSKQSQGENRCSARDKSTGYFHQVFSRDLVEWTFPIGIFLLAGILVILCWKTSVRDRLLPVALPTPSPGPLQTKNEALPSSVHRNQTHAPPRIIWVTPETHKVVRESKNTNNYETKPPPVFEHPEPTPRLQQQPASLDSESYGYMGVVPANTPSDLKSEISSTVKAIKLSRNWASLFSTSSGGGSLTINDLKALLGGWGTPSDTQEVNGLPEFYHSVTYLMPLREAERVLALTNPVRTKIKVACPGLPDGLYYYSYDGNFEEHCNRLYLITDCADQVVSAQIVNEHPKGEKLGHDDYNYHTYNFINTRTKSKKNLKIYSRVIRNNEVVTVDMTLYDPDLNRVLENSRWYVPPHILRLILFCVNKRTASF